jgi:hypothetical protein
VAAAGLILEEERMQARLRAQLAALHDSRARLAAAEAERYRIGRESGGTVVRRGVPCE